MIQQLCSQFYILNLYRLTYYSKITIDLPDPTQNKVKKYKFDVIADSGSTFLWVLHPKCGELFQFMWKDAQFLI